MFITRKQQKIYSILTNSRSIDKMSEEVQTPNSPTPTVESQPSNEEPLTNADEDNRPANAQSETAKVVDDKQTSINFEIFK